MSTSSIKRHTGMFHTLVVRWRQRNAVQKRVMHVQSDRRLRCRSKRRPRLHNLDIIIIYSEYSIYKELLAFLLGIPFVHLLLDDFYHTRSVIQNL